MTVVFVVVIVIIIINLTLRTAHCLMPTWCGWRPPWHARTCPKMGSTAYVPQTTPEGVGDLVCGRTGGVKKKTPLARRCLHALPSLPLSLFACVRVWERERERPRSRSLVSARKHAHLTPSVSPPSLSPPLHLAPPALHSPLSLSLRVQDRVTILIWYTFSVTVTSETNSASDKQNRKYVGRLVYNYYDITLTRPGENEFTRFSWQPTVVTSKWSTRKSPTASSVGTLASFLFFFFF